MKTVFWILQSVLAEVSILGKHNGRLYIEKETEDDIYYKKTIVIDGEQPYRFGIFFKVIFSKFLFVYCF